MNQTDQILEELRPRMHAARVSHVRKLVGAFAVVPLLGIGAMAMASEADAPTEIETAVETETPEKPEVELPEIGDADGDEKAETAAGDHEEAPTTTKAPATTTTVAPDEGQVLEVGVLGKVEIKPTEDGFKVLSASLVDGWEVVESETLDDGTLLIYVTNGDAVKVIRVENGIRDEVLVSIDDWVPPTTTTTTVKPEPQPEPEPPATVDRFSVEVPGHGSFIVERDGDKLYVGNVSPAAGHEYEVHKWEGWKVWVGFYAEGHVWFGKALVNDHGEVELHFWDEEITPEPTYKWVEIGGIGAAKFAILEGQVKVYKVESAEGAWGYVEVGNEYGSTARVVWETEGPAYQIDAWVNEDGSLGWTSGQIT